VRDSAAVFWLGRLFVCVWGGVFRFCSQYWGLSCHFGREGCQQAHAGPPGGFLVSLSFAVKTGACIVMPGGRVACKAGRGFSSFCSQQEACPVSLRGRSVRRLSLVCVCVGGGGSCGFLQSKFGLVLSFQEAGLPGGRECVSCEGCDVQ
jgi:hypothetical protein